MVVKSRGFNLQSALIAVLFMLMAVEWRGGPTGPVWPFFVLGAIFLCAEAVAAALKSKSRKAAVISTAALLFLVPLLAAKEQIFAGLFTAMRTGYFFWGGRMSKIPVAAPAYLAVNYALIPYFAGLAVSRLNLSETDIFFLPALFLFFLAKTSLKDFYEKNKNIDYYFGLIFLIAGGAFLMAALKTRALTAAGSFFYLALLAIIEWQIFKGENRYNNLVAANVGIRIGNGMLLTLLGSLFLSNNGAGAMAQTIFFLSLALPHSWLLLEYFKKPESFRVKNQSSPRHCQCARQESNL